MPSFDLFNSVSVILVATVAVHYDVFPSIKYFPHYSKLRVISQAKVGLLVKVNKLFTINKSTR